MDVLDFNYLINQLLDKISKEQKQIFLLGDFNINLLNYNEQQPINEFLDTLALNSIIPYIFSSFCLPLMCFQILYAINQTSWKEIGQNLTNKTLFFITLIKIGLKFLNLISKNVNLSLDLYLDHMNVILDIHAPY